MNYFIEEIFFLLTIPLLLIFSVFFKPTKTSELNGILYNKYFYLFLNSISFLIFLLFLFDLGQFLFFQPKLSYTNQFFQKDLFNLFFNLFITSLMLFYLLLSKYVFRTQKSNEPLFFEFPIIIYIALASLKIFIFSNDIILLLLSLEITTFCILILLATYQPTRFSLEAAIKYFIFNALGISFLLLALNGYYFLTKTFTLTDLTLVQCLFPAYYYLHYYTFFFYHFIFFFGLFVKLGIVPFHFWVPDVYEGAPMLITAFLVIFIGPVLFFKCFQLTKQFVPFFEKNLLFLFFLVFGLAAVVFGTFMAFNQVRIKRFLAYAGLTHFGYLLLSLGTGTVYGLIASLLYLLIYMVTNVIFFSVLLFVQAEQFSTSKLNFLYISHLKPLFSKNGFFFLSFTIVILSFAGFPPFAGFFAKLMVFFSLIQIKQYILSLFIIFYLVLNAYLYLRFLKIALFEPLTTEVEKYMLIDGLENEQKNNNFFVNFFRLKLSTEQQHKKIYFYFCLFFMISLCGFLSFFIFEFSMVYSFIESLVLSLLTFY